jgi:hypothetical protein
MIWAFHIVWLSAEHVIGKAELRKKYVRSCLIFTQLGNPKTSRKSDIASLPERKRVDGNSTMILDILGAAPSI